MLRYGTTYVLQCNIRVVIPAARTYMGLLLRTLCPAFSTTGFPAQLDSCTTLPDTAAMACGATASALAASLKVRGTTVIHLPFACAFAIDAASQWHRAKNEGRLADAAGNAAACN